MIDETRAADLLLLRFRGRRDLFLRETRDGAHWVREAVDRDLVVEHVRGRRRIGFAVDEPGPAAATLDFDGKQASSGGLHGALQRVRRVAEIVNGDLELAPLLVELSRSGLGCHAWVLFAHDDLPSLDEARGFLRHLLRAAGLPDDGDEKAGHPGIFPHPPARKGVGRAAFLPWSGLTNGSRGGLFCDLNGDVLEDQLAVLEGARPVTRAQLLGATTQLQAMLPSPPPASRRRTTTVAQRAARPTRYAAAALEKETAVVRAAVEGERNSTLNKAAFSLGQLVAGGQLDEAVVEGELIEAALDAGLGEAETRATVRSGIEAGTSQPRAPSVLKRIPRGGDGQRGVRSADSNDWSDFWSDSGNADLFIREKGERLLHVAGAGWHVWTGTHWRRDTTGEVVRLAIESMRGQTLRAFVSKEPDRDKFIRHALKSEGAQRIKGMLELAKVHATVAVETSVLDRDPWLLNVANGTLDLRTAQLRPHSRDDYITHLIPVPYLSSARCPRWEAFLDRVLRVEVEGKFDTVATGNLKTFIKRAVGYSLTGSTRAQCFFLLHGRGANGKSVFLAVIAGLFGSLAQAIPFDTLLHKPMGDGIPNDVARLRGVRLATAIEADAGRRLAEAKVKQLTGGDVIAARFMRREFFEFVPQFKLWVACNHRPDVRGTDHAIWRRIRLVPFDQVIPEKEQDPDLKDKLLEELPGILRWAVEGCLEEQREGLGDPEVVALATHNYRQEQDVVGAFIAERCVLGPGLKVTSKALRKDYCAWAEGNGEPQLSAKALANHLQERSGGVVPAKVSRERGWKGIGLLEGGTDGTDETDSPD